MSRSPTRTATADGAYFALFARTVRFTLRWTHAEPPAPITAPPAHQMTRLNTHLSSRTAANEAHTYG